MTSKLYDRLKFIAQIGLPASGSLYFALAGLWGLPATEQVIGTIVALDTFLGGILQLSSSKYKNNEDRFDGSIDVVDTLTKTSFSINVPGNPYDIVKSKEILLKVNSPESNDKS